MLCELTAPLRARLVVVGSYAELERRAAELFGAIVLYDWPLPTAAGDGCPGESGTYSNAIGGNRLPHRILWY